MGIIQSYINTEVENDHKISNISPVSTTELIEKFQSVVGYSETCSWKLHHPSGQNHAVWILTPETLSNIEFPDQVFQFRVPSSDENTQRNEDGSLNVCYMYGIDTKNNKRCVLRISFHGLNEIGMKKLDARMLFKLYICSLDETKITVDFRSLKDIVHFIL